MDDSETPKSKPKKSAFDLVLKLAIALALFTIAGVIAWRNYQAMGKSAYLPGYDSSSPQGPNNGPQRPGMGNGNGNPNRPGGMQRPGAAQGQGQGQGQGLAQNLGPMGYRVVPLSNLKAVPWGDNDAGTRIQRETLTPDDRLWTDTAGHVTAGKLLAVHDDKVLLQRYGLTFLEPRSSFGKADAAYLATWDARIAAFRTQATSKDPAERAAAAALLPGNPVLTASCIDQVMALCNEPEVRLEVTDPELNPYKETMAIPTAFDAFLAIAVLPPIVLDATQTLQYSQIVRSAPASRTNFLPKRQLYITTINRNVVIQNLVKPSKDVTPTKAATLREWLTDFRRNGGQSAICQYIATSSEPEVAPTYDVLMANSLQAPRELWRDYQRAMQRAGLAAQVQAAADHLAVQGNANRNRPRAQNLAARQQFSGFFESHGLTSEVEAALDDIQKAEKNKDLKLILDTCEWLWVAAPPLAGLYWEKAQAVHLEMAKAAMAAHDRDEAMRHYRAAAALGPLEEKAALTLAKELVIADACGEAWAILISSVDMDSLDEGLADWMTYIQQRELFPGYYGTQQAWVECTLSEQLADMLSHAVGRPASDIASGREAVDFDLKSKTLERWVSLNMPRHKVTLKLSPPSYSHHIFSSEDWQPVLSVISRDAGMPKPAGARPDVDAVLGQRVLADTATLNPEVLAKLDLVLSASLAAAPADPQQHEYAAMLLLAMSLREVMPYLARPLDAYTLAAAHLTFARWLNGGDFATPVGPLAEATLNQRVGRMVDGQALLASTPVVWADAEAPWRRMLALEASRDYSQLADMKEQPPIVRLAYLDVLLQSDRAPVGALDQLEALLTTPESMASPELVYLGMASGSPSTGVDKRVVKGLLDATISEWRAVRAHYESTPADMQMDLNLVSTSIPNRALATSIVGWQRWCSYYQRRMNCAFMQSMNVSLEQSGISYDMATAIAKEFPRLMGTSADAEAVKSLVSNGKLSNLERLAAYRKYATTRPELLTPALWREFENDLVNYASDRGTVLNSSFDGFGHRYGWAPEADAKGDFKVARLESAWPSMMRWIGTKPLPGTTYGVIATGDAMLTVDPGFLSGDDAASDPFYLLALKLDPYRPETLETLYERRKELPDAVKQEVLAALDHLSGYNFWAQAWLKKRETNMASGDGPNADPEAAYKLAVMADPSQAVAYGKWLWRAGRRDDAIAVWESYANNATGNDAATMAFFIPQILGYLTGTGSPKYLAIAHRLAERTVDAGSAAGMDALCTIQLHEGTYAAAFDTAIALATKFNQTDSLKMVTDYAALRGDRSLIARYRAVLIDLHQNPGRDTILGTQSGNGTPTVYMSKFVKSNDPIVGGLRVREGATRAPAVGLRAGDLFVALNGWAMRDLSDFYAALSLDAKPTVQMTVLRGNELLTYDSPAPHIDVDADLEPADPDHLRTSPNPALRELEMRVISPPLHPGSFQLGGVGDNNGQRRYAIPPEAGTSRFYTYQTDAATLQTQLFVQDLESPGPPVAVGPPIDPPLVSRLVGVVTVGDTVYVAGNASLDAGLVLKITPTTVTRIEPDNISLAGRVSDIVVMDGQILVGFNDTQGSRGGLVRVNPTTDSFETLYGLSTSSLNKRQAMESTLGVARVLVDAKRGVVWFEPRSVSKSRHESSLGIFTYTPSTQAIAPALSTQEVDGSLLRLAPDGSFILSRRHELISIDPDSKQSHRLAVSTAKSTEEATYLLDGWMRREFWLLGDRFVRQHEGMLVLRKPESRVSTILRYGIDSHPLDTQIKPFQYGDSLVLFGHGSGAITLLRPRPGEATSPGWIDCATLIPAPVTAPPAGTGIGVGIGTGKATAL